MNRDQSEGKWSELQVQSGKFTDDKLMQTESGYDNFTGSLQKRYGEQSEVVRRRVEPWYQRQQRLAGPHASENRLGASVKRQ